MGLLFAVLLMGLPLAFAVWNSQARLGAAGSRP